MPRTLATKHQVCTRHAAKRACDLCHNIKWHIAPYEPTLPTIHECDRGIEVSVRDRTERENDSDQCSARRNRVCKKSDSDVSTTQTFPIMPEPTTAARSNAVPRNSAVARRANVMFSS